uniref:Uncharacterized protein n=1 Tax=Triticum urartu TaxID=4572 RepID=A0A8R7TGR0_TRIUA
MASSSSDHGNHEHVNGSPGPEVRNLTHILLDLFSMFLSFLSNWLLTFS